MRPGQPVIELIAGPAGTLEVAHLPAAPNIAARGIALVAHPLPLQGGTMDNKVAVTLAKTLHQLGYATLRFNFRGVGRSEGTWDEGIGETDDAEAALAHLEKRYPGLKGLVLAGFSFGTFVQARLWHRIHASRPLERFVMAGPAVNRFQIDTLPAPDDTIIVHGEEDDVVPLADVMNWARPQHLPIVVLPGCGHFFHGRLTQLQRVITGMWRC